MRLAFFQPDIPQNLGAGVRLCACLGVPLDVIEPCSFPLSDRGLRRAALDYAKTAVVERHAGWDAFLAAPPRREGRLVLFSTKGEASYLDFPFAEGDTLLFGRESAGAPESVHKACDACLVIPMAPGARSLNIICSAAMGLGEALRRARRCGFQER
jgi:tRNA (cytidine/uridine-2'-O-)-methyltransferase